MPVGASTIIEVRDLKKYFTIKTEGVSEEKSLLKAVDGVSLDVYEGEILGVVGESGCGKSTLGKTIMRLHDKTDGQVLYRGKDLFAKDPSAMKDMTLKMQMIFQDPYSSLNPRKKVSKIIGQPLDIHKIGTPEERLERVAHLMDEVGLTPVFRWATPEDRYRPCSRIEPRIHRLRRSRLRPGCLRTGPDTQPAVGLAGEVWVHVPVHRTRPCGRRVHSDPDPGHVLGKDR
jgi:ABC-type glutathione transport system ATPase component